MARNGYPSIYPDYNNYIKVIRVYSFKTYVCYFHIRIPRLSNIRQEDTNYMYFVMNPPARKVCHAFCIHALCYHGVF